MLTLCSLNSFEVLSVPQAPQLQQDRVSIRSASGLTCSSTLASDMIISAGVYQDSDQYGSNNGDFYNTNQGEDQGVYISATIPITFGSKKKVDCNRLYELELEVRETELQTLKKELELLKKVKSSNTFSIN